ncbi:MAG TPA: DMT family transporter [Brumimicrobium sp.]|nr:DMT family transporter [Brumimicrobium sp.]
MERFKYHILMHVIILVWGFTGILGKLILLPPEIIVWYRIIITVISLLILFPIFKVPYLLKDKKDLGKLMLVGIIVCLHWITFYKAISLSTASLAVLCLSTTTLHVSWIDPIIMKRRFSWIEFLFGVLVIFGIYYISADFSAAEYEVLAYGLTSALLAALFSVSNAKFAEKISSSQIILYEMIAGVIFLTIVLFSKGQLTAANLTMTISDFWWLLFLGIVCTSLAFVLMVDVVKKLGAFTASLTINLEPVYTMVLAILILNENEILGKKFYLGSAMIILVVIANAVVKSKMKKRLRRKLI